ncbi:MAG: ureidoglycolate lyase [Gammaproteobacteria bacterium]|jgi:ureidoglycolate lyase|nr:ureidoglycolate lyase [Gammaproteobacteria bacterium]MBU0827769.1 ureidoglycolate lyase [Gammaproteobacteria bacterium]MBU0892908.1 ureidoglycolate lyase [Gammaproteobacteria bacterium]MBU1816939.1 ureidoglycolate lyase [Gammaproteobacteria bacterium]
MTATSFPSDDAARLVPALLTAAAFQSFGTVLQPPSGAGRAINAGSSERFDLVDDLQLGAFGGRAQLALFRAQARSFPLQILEMERHCLGSQTFVPWGVRRFVVVVAPAGDPPVAAASLQAFVTNGRQGVVLAPGTWHHALLAVDSGDFLVIERAASVTDCDVHRLAAPVRLACP